MDFRELQELAPDVYLFPRDTATETIQPNVGVIRSRDQTILIDAGNSLHHARHVMASMAGSRFPSIDTVIYTHHHWDHTFGACVYNATHIIAHDATAPRMAEYAAQEWNDSILKARIEENPRLEPSYGAMRRAIKNWSRFYVRRPTMTFSEQLWLHLPDGLSLHLRHVAPSRHADGSIVVAIPERGIVFLGDCYYPPPFHLRQDGDEDLALWLLDELADEGYDWYIDGHGDPRTLAAFEAMIDDERQRQQAPR